MLEEAAAHFSLFDEYVKKAYTLKEVQHEHKVYVLHPSYSWYSVIAAPQGGFIALHV